MTPPVFVIAAADLSAASAGDVVRLDGTEGRHAASVRRMGVGEELTLVDGDGNRADGSVSAVHDRQSLDVLVAKVHHEPTPRPSAVVVQALPKGERGELAVELLTEVGVDVIVPWAAATCVTQWNSERRERGLRRWRDAARAAGKQARRARFPVVETLATTADVVARVQAAAVAVVFAAAAAGAQTYPTGTDPRDATVAQLLTAQTAAAAAVRIGRRWPRSVKVTP